MAKTEQIIGRQAEKRLFGSRWIVLIAAVSGLVGVGIGAMGSHSLPLRLREAGLTEELVQKKIGQCETAVKYQMFHTLAVLAIGLCPVTEKRPAWKVACILFVVGMCFFSGGLYAIVFLDTIGHWSIVPLGGTILMIAWITLGAGALFPVKSRPGTSEMVS